MKSFTSYLLIGIILTFVSFVVFGIFSDDSMTLKANTRLQGTNTTNVSKVLNDINHTKEWSLLFKEEGIEYELDEDEKEIEWKREGKESWVKLKINQDQNTTTFTTSSKGQDDMFMTFYLSQDNKDVEVECTYKMEIPLIYRFFKKSMKEHLTEDLNNNLMAFKAYIEKL